MHLDIYLYLPHLGLKLWSRFRLSVLLLLVLVISNIVSMHGASAADQVAGRISFVEGQVQFKRTFRSAKESATLNTSVGPGSKFTTGSNGRLEITLLDQSVVRLGPRSIYRIKLAAFSGGRRSRFTANLDQGRVWVKARRALGRGRESFQITTPSAVLGIRGTTYDLQTNLDNSAQVSVFEGLVAVAPPPIEEGASHEEISWPVEVSESAWEEIILGQLQRVIIDANGQPSQAIEFSPDQEKDPWVAWNLLRDKAL